VQACFQMKCVPLLTRAFSNRWASRFWYGGGQQAGRGGEGAHTRASVAFLELNHVGVVEVALAMLASKGWAELFVRASGGWGAWAIASGEMRKDSSPATCLRCNDL